MCVVNLCACGCGASVAKKWKHGHNPKTAGKRFTSEHRAKLSESNKGKQAGERHPNYGKSRSEETKRKLSAALQGRVITEEMRLKISATKLAEPSQNSAAVHRWLKRWYPKTGCCERCGAVGRTDYASLTAHVYTRQRADYAELCSSCHLRLDYLNGQRSSQAGKPKPRRRRQR